MELVYPIYLDVPMMTAFLASLEGGLIEKADIERKSGDAKEITRSASFGVKISQLLSGIVGGGIKADFSKKMSESLEAQYRSTVQFPDTTLFIRLRSLLMEKGVLVSIHSKSDLEGTSLGNFVEIQGLAVPSPVYQIRRLFSQLEPIIKAAYNITDSQLDQEILRLETAKPGDVFKLGEEEVVIQNNKHKSTISEIIKITQKSKQNESSLYQMIGQALTILLPEDATDVVLIQSDEFRAMCRVYPEYVRNQRVQDIYDASWRCIGKVIATIRDGEKFDLLKGAPISYFARDQFPALVSSLNTESISVEVTESVIKGPSIIIATMAVFS